MLPPNRNLRAMRSSRIGDAETPQRIKLCVVEPDKKNYAALSKRIKLVPNSARVQRFTLAKRVDELRGTCEDDIRKKCTVQETRSNLFEPRNTLHSEMCHRAILDRSWIISYDFK